MTSILQELEPGARGEHTPGSIGGTRNTRRFNSEFPRGFNRLIFGANAVARARSVVGVGKLKLPRHHALHFYDRGNALLSESKSQNHVVYFGAETHPIQPFVPFVVALCHSLKLAQEHTREWQKSFRNRKKVFRGSDE